jgi:hypothetical protein
MDFTDMGGSDDAPSWCIELYGETRPPLLGDTGVGWQVALQKLIVRIRVFHTLPP